MWATERSLSEQKASAKLSLQKSNRAASAMRVARSAVNVVDLAKRSEALAAAEANTVDVSRRCTVNELEAR